MKCYAAYAKDVEVRKLGSSGAVFPVIATEFVINGGIVYASVYDENFNVKLKRIDNVDDLGHAFSSKYMQSNSYGVYEKVSNDLESGYKVLFCGTPCHVKALCKYLSIKKVSINNLLLIDIICHGVPSQKVFHMFLDSYEEKKIVALNMRNKDFGWNWGNYSWEMVFDNGQRQVVKQKEIPFMKGFLSNMFSRPSCYHCMSKDIKYSDITLGDFWKISNTNIEVDDRYGVSCVIINTDKGNQSFNKISYLLDTFDAKYEDILAGNHALIGSYPMPYSRHIFFKNLNKYDSISCLIDDINNRNKLVKAVNKIYSKFLPKKNAKEFVVDNTYKKLIDFKRDCSGCMACSSVCTKDAITYKFDNEGFSYPVIIKEKCVSCGLCEGVCPQR